MKNSRRLTARATMVRSSGPGSAMVAIQRRSSHPRPRVLGRWMAAEARDLGASLCGASACARLGAWPYSTSSSCASRPTSTEMDQAELRQRVETSSYDIGWMRELRFVRLVLAESANGYQYLMSRVFDNKADLDNYMGHPVHSELAEWAASRGCEFMVFDYDLDAATATRQPA